MSYIDSYSMTAMAGQRQRDLIAEAALSRLATAARANHPAWWRRLLRGWSHTTAKSGDSVAPSASLRGARLVGRRRRTAVAR